MISSIVVLALLLQLLQPRDINNILLFTAFTAQFQKNTLFTAFTAPVATLLFKCEGDAVGIVDFLLLQLSHKLREENRTA